MGERTYNWDEVERELFILSAQISRVSKTFGEFAKALRREREFANCGGTEGPKRDYFEPTEQKGGGGQDGLPF